MNTRVGVLLVRWLFGGPTLAMLALMVSPLEAQRVRFPSGARVGPGGAVVGPGGGVIGAPPAVTLQPPVATPFDPYALGPKYGVTTTTPGYAAPSLPPPVWTAPNIGGFASPPPVVQGPPVFQGQPPGVQGLPPFANPNLPPALPGQPYPATTPGAIFPDGVFPGGGPNLGGWFGGINALEPPPYLRLFEDFYGRFTWIYGDAGPTKTDELQIEEIEVATSLVIPGSLGVAEEFRVTPGFIYDALGGPFSTTSPIFPFGPIAPPAGALSLPSNLYSAYLDSYALAQFTPQVGGELNVRVGVYSDFDKVTSDSIRTTGRGLLLLRLTPTLTVKGGVEYLDRNDIHLLPAGGVLWEPNPQTRFDIYFPRPKLAKYLSTVGANEIWWYVGGEYGGGAWVVEDTAIAPYTGRIDINDIRVFAGLDFTRPSNLTGFVEGGYVFEREIFYVDIAPPNVFSLKETFMVRAGLIW